VRQSQVNGLRREALVASVIISEIGADIAEYFSTDAHLASWAGLCPGNHESAGKRKHGRPRKGNQHLKPALVEAARAAVQTDGRLRARYHRLVLRFGGYRNKAARKKAIVAVAHTLILIIWHVLTEGIPYAGLGADSCTRRIDPQHETRRLIARLEELGHKITIQPAAA
jgi:transposase